MKFAFLLAAALCCSGAAKAEDLPGFEAAEAAYVAAWNALPLSVREVHFISEPSAGFGRFAVRENAVFRPGEPILSYAEPVGYAFRKRDDGQYEFGVVIDFAIRNEAGDVIAEKAAFSQSRQDSNLMNRALSLDLSMDLKGAAPGRYVLTYVVHDAMSDDSTTFDQPFEIAE